MALAAPRNDNPSKHNVDMSCCINRFCEAPDAVAQQEKRERERDREGERCVSESKIIQHFMTNPKIKQVQHRKTQPTKKQPIKPANPRQQKTNHVEPPTPTTKKRSCGTQQNPQNNKQNKHVENRHPPQSRNKNHVAMPRWRDMNIGHTNNNKKPPTPK